MGNKLIHIAPFDIGCSFFDYDYSKKQSRQDFIKSISLKCREKGIIIDETPGDRYMCVAKLNEKITCYLLESGVGVFTFENIFVTDTARLREVFGDSIACDLYYRKRTGQKKILNLADDISIVKDFMDIVWSSVNKKTRPFSACRNYKYNGLSYVMAIYHIIDHSRSLGTENNSEIDLLMNPVILLKIDREDQWDSIKEKLQKHKTTGYDLKEFSEASVVASSWSAVAVIEEKETEVISRITEYEIYLQACWFFFDCLVDNIKKSRLSNLELQKIRSIVRDVSLEISNVLSANMSTSERNVMQSIYKTSGIDIIKEKLLSLLDNRIAIEEARISEKQAIYGMITEILLVLFTLVSIYEPVKNLINGSIAAMDLIIGGIMFVVLIVCSILIIGKGK